MRRNHTVNVTWIMSSHQLPVASNQFPSLCWVPCLLLSSQNMDSIFMLFFSFHQRVDRLHQEQLVLVHACTKNKKKKRKCLGKRMWELPPGLVSAHMLPYGKTTKISIKEFVQSYLNKLCGSPHLNISYINSKIEFVNMYGWIQINSILCECCFVSLCPLTFVSKRSKEHYFIDQSQSYFTLFGCFHMQSI